MHNKNSDKNLILFKPGQSGNLSGRPKKWITTLKKQGWKASEVNDAISVMMQMTVTELMELYQNPETTVLEKTIAGAIRKSIQHGSLYSLETLLNRVHGKPKEQTENKHIHKIIVEYGNADDKTTQATPGAAEDMGYAETV
jgi:hypothetical protein